MEEEAFFTGPGRVGRGKAKNLRDGAGRSLNLRGGEHTVYIRVSQKKLTSLNFGTPLTPLVLIG